MATLRESRGANEVLDRAFDGDLNFSEDTKRFIDRHVSPGEKRPPAPSVRRGDQSGHAKGARMTAVGANPSGEESRRRAVIAISSGGKLRLGLAPFRSAFGR